MNQIQNLIDAIATARYRYLALTQQFTESEANWKPQPAVWNLVEITEHLFWAE